MFVEVMKTILMV